MRPRFGSAGLIFVSLWQAVLGSAGCACDHLTTFSLIFGNFGDAPSESLEILSRALGALSIAGLLSTQLFLFYNT